MLPSSLENTVPVWGATLSEIKVISCSLLLWSVAQQLSSSAFDSLLSESLRNAPQTLSLSTTTALNNVPHTATGFSLSVQCLTHHGYCSAARALSSGRQTSDF